MYLYLVREHAHMRQCMWLLSAGLQAATKDSLQGLVWTPWGLFFGLGMLMFSGVPSKNRIVWDQHQPFFEQSPYHALAQRLTLVMLWTLQDAYERSSKLLKQHAKELHALASALLESETLSGEQIKALLAGLKNHPQQVELQPGSSATAAAAAAAAASDTRAPSPVAPAS